MLPSFYQTHLQKQLTHAQFILLKILIDLIPSEKHVRIERLTRVFPYPIKTESRRRKLQKFLDLPQLTLALWFPLSAYCLTTYCSVGQRLSLAIYPTSMGLYQSVHVKRSYPEGNRFNLAAHSYPIILVFITQIRK